jgi:hypothetical protein
MIHPAFLRALSLLMLVLAVHNLRAAEAPLPIEGPADKRHPGYSDRVTIRVPSTPGYSYSILLDTNPILPDVTLDVTSIDYHELNVWRTNDSTLVVTNRRLQFIVRSSVRNANQSVEDGVPVFTPYPMIASTASEFAEAQLHIVAPAVFPAGYEIPVVAWIRNPDGGAVRVNGDLSIADQSKFSIKRGVGSGFLTSTNPAGPLNFTASISGLQTNGTITLETAPTWTSISGTLGGDTVFPEDSRLLVTANLTIPAGATVTIGAGSIVRLNSRVDILLDGQMTINGSVAKPVVFMPNSRAQPWGGFLLRFNTSQITGTGVIFTGSGGDLDWFGTSGRPGSHRDEQALFYLTNAMPRVSLTDSAAIYLSGQLGHAVNGGRINFDRFLMQRTTTGGEYTGANFTVNDSAFIECPDDTGNYVDADNDGLYLVSGTHGFTNTLFGWMKDDGIDSGGSSAGIMNYERCLFESIFHEGNSLSGTGKQVSHYNGVFINCGQGIEDGYSGPTGKVDRCFISACLVGVRFGDNYAPPSFTYSGTIRATNSIVAFNYRDVWGMNFQDWAYRASAMDVRSNFLGVPNIFHPNNSIYDPARDGWRLTNWMSTPPQAPVGIGIALRSGFLTNLSAGVPVRLSSFTTNHVSVAYAVESDSGVLSTGSVEFVPGETLKIIPIEVAQPQNHRLIRVALRNPVQAELTGLSRVYLAQETENPPLVARGSVWRYLADGSNQGTNWRRADFDDTAWSSGPSELGFGDDDETTPIPDNNQITTYFRHAFTVDDPADFSGLSLWLLRDDGGVVYLNGSEVFRSPNMPAGTIAFNTLTVGATAEDAIDTATLPAASILAGTNVVAVEIHQQTASSSDVSFNFELIGNPTIGQPEVQIVRFGNEVALIWNDPTYGLEAAESISGPWTSLTSPSPTTVLAVGNRFYRLKK